MKPLLSKIVLLACSVLMLACAAWGATGKDVSYKSGNEIVKGVLYTPPNPHGRLPALVVIHEFWGLNDWVKDQAAKLADQGYVTLAVDLYRGHVATTPEEAHELMRGVPEDRANRDLLAAADFLSSQEDVDPNRVGVIGWCMGGGYALDLAIADPKLKAAVINYGHLATDPANLEKIHAALLGIFGGLDRGIPPADVHAFEKQLQSEGKTVQIKVYDDAGHAFENPNNKDGYKPQDAADAWSLTTAFLDKHLKH